MFVTLVIVVVGFLCGYYLKNIFVYVLSALGISFVLYHLLFPLPGLALYGVIPVASSILMVLGVCFLASLWFGAIIANRAFFARLFLRTKNAVMRGTEAKRGAHD